MSKQDDLLRDIDGLGGLEASERLPAIQGILRGIVGLCGSMARSDHGGRGGGGGGGGWDSSGTKEEIKARVTKLLDSKSEEISEWEKGFLIDMEKKAFYSDKMKAVINKCYKQVFE